MTAGPDRALRWRLPYTSYARKEEILYCLLPGLISLGVLVAGILAWGPIATVAGALGIVTALIVSTFFRDPHRPIPGGDEDLISPADGKVITVGEVTDEPFVGVKGLQIDIFLSPLNAHVNRSPIDGVVD